MMKYIKRADIFGENINFTFDNHDSAKTIIGGILSVIIYLISIVLLIFEAKDFFLKLNPTISSYVNVKRQRDPVTLNKTTIPFAFGLNDDNNTNYNQYVDFSVNVVSIDFKDGKAIYNTQPSLNIIQCKKDHFPEITENEFAAYNLSNYRCINDLNITLSGFWSETHLTYLDLKVNLCGSSDTEGKCMENRNNLDLARKLNRNIFLTFYFQNNILNTKNYTNFTVPFSDVLVLRLEPDFFKYAQVFIKKQTLITDDGPIWENPSRKDIYSLDSYYSDFTMRTDKLLYNINLHPSSKSYEERRVYNRIQSILADVGAIFDYLRFSASLICIMFASTKKNVTIMNRLFEFDWSDEKNSKREKTTSKEINKLNNDKQIGTKNSIQVYLGDNSFSSSPHGNNKNLRINQVSYKDKTIIRGDENYSGSNLNLNNDKDKSVNNLIHKKISIQEKPDFENHKIELNSRDDNKHSKSKSIEMSIMPKNENFENNKNGIIDNTKFNSRNEVEQKKFGLMNIRRKALKKRKINFSFLEIIKTNLFCCLIKNNRLKKKYKLYNEGVNKLDKMFDICYLMNKLEEIEKLKFILLNKKQIIMFNLLSRDICTLNPNKATLNYFYKMKKFENNKNGIENIMREVKQTSLNNSKNFDDIDKRLFNMLSGEVREYLNFK